MVIRMSDKQKARPSAGPPADFLDKMRRLLGEEAYAEFVASYDEPERIGLRVNTLKIRVDDFIRKSPFRLTPVGDYEPAGFLAHGVTEQPSRSVERPGSHPYHAAGLYYLQEPSAMVVGSVMRPQPGELVLDLAAAPGGKATHLITLMGDEGLLVANEVNAGRVRYLAENLERWGARNTLITNDTPERLAAAFGPVFDRVLVDAPCSGEGMFRRQGGFDWSEAIVAACARRQTAILDTAADLVRPGGLLAYTTCTFSPEEDEAVVARFLATHADYELVAPPQYAGFAPGRPDWLEPDWLPAGQAEQLRHAVRLWPHRFVGEGHFIALLRRESAGAIRPPAAGQPPRISVPPEWRAFAAEHLRGEWPADRLQLVNNRLYLLPARRLAARSLHIIRYGLLLGEVRKGYFRPAHTLALALRRDEVVRTADWTAGSAEIGAYLAGHDLPAPGPDGWVLVTVDGFGLGWGKRVNGRLKNHYPRGLRLVG